MTNAFKSKNNRDTIVAGFILLLIGIIIIIKQTIEDFPGWVVSWPMILVVVGIFVGIRHGFRGPGWIILIGVGCIFLADKVMPGANLKRYALPVGIIVLGLFLIFAKSSQKARLYRDMGADCGGNDRGIGVSGAQDGVVGDENDILESVSIFGSSKKVVFAKNFKGGEVVNILGGSEINCSQADIQGVAKLEVVQVFGGTKIIVPASWTVSSNATSIFGGFEDKRAQVAHPDPGKVLVIDGTTIFGGIEIKSF